jgi:hypothetical protein
MALSVLPGLTVVCQLPTMSRQKMVYEYCCPLMTATSEWLPASPGVG